MMQGVLRPVLSGLVVGGLVAAGLAGCSVAGDEPPEPTVAPVVVEEPPHEPEPEPEPSPEPGPEPPVPTAAMNTPDRAGAEAAAVYFIELYAYTFASGDVSEWERRSGDTCRFCASVQAEVERVYDGGGWYEGVGVVDVSRAEVSDESSEPSWFAVHVDFELTGGAEVDREGSLVEDYGVERGSVMIEVVPSERGWVLVEGTAVVAP